MEVGDELEDQVIDRWMIWRTSGRRTRELPDQRVIIAEGRRDVVRAVGWTKGC